MSKNRPLAIYGHRPTMPIHRVNQPPEVRQCEVRGCGYLIGAGRRRCPEHAEGQN